MAYRHIAHEVLANGTYNAVFSFFKGNWSDAVIGLGNTLDLQVDAAAHANVTLAPWIASNLNLVAAGGITDINMNGGVWRGTLINNSGNLMGRVSLHGTGVWLNQHAEIGGGNRTFMALPETVTLGGVGDIRITRGARMEFIGTVGADQTVSLENSGNMIIDHLATFHAAVHLGDQFTSIHIAGTLAENWMITDLPGPVDRVDFFHGAAHAGSLLLDHGATAPHITLTAPGVIDITGGIAST